MKHCTLIIILVISASGLSAQTETQETPTPRYYNHTLVSLLIGEESEDQTRKAMIPSFQTITGIRLGDHAGVGLGVGVEPFEYVIFPVFISGNYFFSDKKTAPYFAAKAGYAFANSHKRLEYNYYDGEFSNKGGVMLHPEVGLRFKLPYFDMTLSGGYRYQHMESRISREGSPYMYRRKVDYNRVSVTLGIMF
jgi:hypothetical protein